VHTPSSFQSPAPSPTNPGLPEPSPYGISKPQIYIVQTPSTSSAPTPCPSSPNLASSCNATTAPQAHAVRRHGHHDEGGLAYNNSPVTTVVQLPVQARVYYVVPQCDCCPAYLSIASQQAVIVSSTEKGTRGEKGKGRWYRRLWR
jgi:hypothetical protein